MENTPSVTMIFPASGSAACEQLLQVLHVVVAELAAPSAKRQPDAVHQRGVVLPVAEDDVVPAQDGGHGGQVGLEAGGADQSKHLN